MTHLYLNFTFNYKDLTFLGIVMRSKLPLNK